MRVTLEKWGVFELALTARVVGNPFDATITASFTNGPHTVAICGFYDGGDVFRLRFMPTETGTWRYETHSDVPALNGATGEFDATEAQDANHGPVRVSGRHHFAYADGTAHRLVGTTCYAWTHQSEALQEKTLHTLAAAPFNKIRMCIFPKWYPFNHTEPEIYPFQGTAPADWDFTRLNPEYFQRIERRIVQLGLLGIEADLILFHPYDEERWEIGTEASGSHWGFDRMGAEHDDRYLRYVVARLSAYRNVWWSLANEWDFVKSKSEPDWNRLGEIVSSVDPYRHLTSIHNGSVVFDQSKRWITHVSLQSDKVGEAREIRERHGKPLVYDECCYEGDIEQDWGNITAQKMLANFWKTFVEGAYCGHGETYIAPCDELWWSKGGELRGESPRRIAFLRRIMDDAPANGEPIDWPGVWGVAGEYYLAYTWDRQTTMRHIHLTDDAYVAELIDTWAMTITPLPGTYSGFAEFALPARPYMALRIVRQ